MSSLWTSFEMSTQPSGIAMLQKILRENSSARASVKNELDVTFHSNGLQIATKVCESLHEPVYGKCAVVTVKCAYCLFPLIPYYGAYCV
ncbi:hypothetical protein TNIN_84091 [Trichonephila inaurata madagascariensis]|uniref:Uncharacterized protein n=1 Tax=Trichonephila inaurata madagascariensis TaxID=2747483 RepID=A0A8X6X0P6_9ARAC|nr:hypothetical protein TNIN_84091 [Trichonephila inaurata madagascariensis]